MSQHNQGDSALPNTTASPTVKDDNLEQTWAMLTRGAADKRSPLNTPAIATVDADGLAQVRTVVLRACRPSERMLECHTDLRSAKVSELSARPALTWHFWDHRSRIQVRATSTATVHHRNEHAADAWDRLHSGGRRIYRQIAPPGQPVSDADAAANDLMPEPDALENFVRIITHVTALERLHLARDGHRRNRWVWDAEAGAWIGTAIAP
ncbi:MAG: pyridoxamine 5'-phosphate oxidase family protein [Pseudomonadota bacterium]